MQDLERLIAGVTPVYGTPIVGIWENGKLISRGWGSAAIEILSRFYGVEGL
jgi:hypothetical protein